MLKISSRAEARALIGPGWHVLDVGSGDSPFPLATVLVDRMPRSHASGDNIRHENPSGALVRHGLPLVVADIEALPFPDQAFDFVYTSHVVEHVTDPGRALGELMRVAPCGYIECPRAWFEFVDSSPFHKWLIDVAGGELLFRPKTATEMAFGQARRLYDLDPQVFAQCYGQVFTHPGAQDPGGANLIKSICHVCIYWEESIPYRILPPSMYADEGTA